MPRIKFQPMEEYVKTTSKMFKFYKIFVTFYLVNQLHGTEYSLNSC
jgi:hypothetical protein